MLIPKPSPNSSNLYIHHKNHIISFKNCNHYPQTHGLVWLGKNSKQELLSLTFNTSSTTALYLAHHGFYFGTSPLGQPVHLQKNDLTNNLSHCVAPATVSYFIKPALSTLNAKSQQFHFKPNHGLKLKRLKQNKRYAQSKGQNSPTTHGTTPITAKQITINILFLYSKEYVSTYKEIHYMHADINELCAITSGIFTENTPLYHVTIQNVHTQLMPNLQNGKNAFNKLDISLLLDEFLTGCMPKIEELKLKCKANVVVFLVKVVCHFIYLGCATSIGFRISRETAIALGKSNIEKYKNIVELCPTILNHEMGHLLGCSHPLTPYEVPEARFVPGYGHQTFKHFSDRFKQLPTNGTIMSYAPSNTWYYSNPNRFDYPDPEQNVPCGVKGISEAYRVVEANLPRLATLV